MNFTYGWNFKILKFIVSSKDYLLNKIWYKDDEYEILYIVETFFNIYIYIFFIET